MDDPYYILTPGAYRALLARLSSRDNRQISPARSRLKMQIELMMNTGMRYKELQEFGNNTKWFKPAERSIVLPATATKTKRGRTVHLTPQFSEKLEMFLSSNYLKFPARVVMNENLIRWGTPARCKTFRKSWETWLIFSGFDSLIVAASQGHSQTIQIAHYQNMIGALKNEAEAVKELTRGWMT